MKGFKSSKQQCVTYLDFTYFPLASNDLRSRHNLCAIYIPFTYSNLLLLYFHLTEGMSSFPERSVAIVSPLFAIIVNGLSVAW